MQHVTVKLGAGAQAAIDKLLEAVRRPYYFVHINKCGGTSVAGALELHQFHKDARSWRDQIGPQNWNAIRTFSVVRHPYERICSMYRYEQQQQPCEGPQLELNAWLAQTFAADGQPRRNDQTMARCCTDWLVDEAGRPMVDLVVRLEDIERDWHLIQQITRSDAPLLRLNTTRIDLGSSVADLTQDSIAIIDAVFADDFDNFGYGHAAEFGLDPAARLLPERPRWSRVEGSV